MTVRDIIFQRITDDEEFAEVFCPKERVKSGGSFTAENAPDRPFAVLRWGVENPGMAGMTRRLLTIWLHDEVGSYDRIDSGLSRLKAILDGAEQLQDADGSWMNLATWQTTSGELYDPGYRTNTRTATYEIIGTGV